MKVYVITSHKPHYSVCNAMTFLKYVSECNCIFNICIWCISKWHVQYSMLFIHLVAFKIIGFNFASIMSFVGYMHFKFRTTRCVNFGRKFSKLKLLLIISFQLQNMIKYWMQLSDNMKHFFLVSESRLDKIIKNCNYFLCEISSIRSRIA